MVLDPSLPSINTLTPSMIVDLLFYSRVTRASLKVHFKAALLERYGVKRGQIPLLYLREKEDEKRGVVVVERECTGQEQEKQKQDGRGGMGETKMISRCNADELGAYLAHLIISSRDQ